ncbi:MAG: ABC transporter permease [Candidatus Hydrogenedentes bacterium]|nr:ABC transporter permease [Candidatus Hydrogenedentota bacterium]
MRADSPKRFPSPRPLLTVGRLKRTVSLGFKSVMLHRLRSMLTVLGLVFGVCSVIAMLAVGEGASHEAQEQIRRLGSNNIILKSVKPPDEQRNSSQRSFVLEYGLTYADVRAIRNTVPSVSMVAPSRVIRETVWNGPHKISGKIIGTLPSYPELGRGTVSRGRFFTNIEFEHAKNICVLGATMAEVLFPVNDPIGRNVRIGSDYYKVIGIMAGAFNSERAGSDEESVAVTGDVPSMYIPLSAARTRFGETLVRRRPGSFEAERIELHEAIVQVKNQEDVLETALIVKNILSRSHAKDDYDMIVPLELLHQAEETKRIFNIVLGAIAAISLLVGGIGIMNIMLASVTERTREIGIRRAMGAKRRDIVAQFLIETVLLSGIGGAAGVILGIIVPALITRSTGMVTVVTVWSPVLAFSISGIVGVVFGLYPALRAAHMDPVEALRHE